MVFELHDNVDPRKCTRCKEYAEKDPMQRFVDRFDEEINRLAVFFGEKAKQSDFINTNDLTAPEDEDTNSIGCPCDYCVPVDVDETKYKDTSCEGVTENPGTDEIVNPVYYNGNKEN